MHSKSNNRHAINQQHNQKVIKLLHRIASTPGRWQVTQQDDGLPDVTPVPGATPVQTLSRTFMALMHSPKSLHDLWVKWKFGTGGRKAASTFNKCKRDTVKSLFSFRLVFWTKIEEMIRSRMPAQLACDEVYRVYGQRRSVTYILRVMKHDEVMAKWPPALHPSYL